MNYFLFHFSSILSLSHSESLQRRSDFNSCILLLYIFVIVYCCCAFSIKLNQFPACKLSNTTKCVSSCQHLPRCCFVLFFCVWFECNFSSNLNGVVRGEWARIRGRLIQFKCESLCYFMCNIWHRSTHTHAHKIIHILSHLSILVSMLSMHNTHRT